jgi:hypothetical protein
VSKGKHGGRFARRGLKVALTPSALVPRRRNAYAAYRYDIAADRIRPAWPSPASTSRT